MSVTIPVEGLHGGKPITEIVVSPNDLYLITYSDADRSFVGWDVKDKDEGQLNPDGTHLKVIDKLIIKMCVSDEKILAYIYRNILNIVDMKDIKKKIAVYFSSGLYSNYCAFNLDNKFILHGNIYEYGIEKPDGYIWIYNTKNESAKQSKKCIWECEKIHVIPQKYELVSISKDDKMYLLSDNSIYEWNIVTRRMVGSIFVNGEYKLKKKDIRDIKIASNKYFICLRHKNKIIIYSIELDIPIASLDIQHDGEQLNKLMDNSGLFPLLPSLSSLFGEVCWKECLDHLKEKEKVSLSAEDQAESLKVVQTTSDYVFEILNGYVQKSKLVKKIDFLKYANEETSNKSSPKKINEEPSKNDNDEEKLSKENAEKYGRLNVHLFNPVMDTEPFHEDLTRFIKYVMFNEHDDKEVDKDNQIDKDNQSNRDDKDVKECIYIEVPKNVLMDESSAHVDIKKESSAITVDDSQFFYIKVPTIAPADDKLEDKHEEAELNEDKQEKYEVKEFIYIKVLKSALKDFVKDKYDTKISTNTSGNLVQNFIKIKIVQTFKRNDYINEWELTRTDVEIFGKKWSKRNIIEVKLEESQKIEKLNVSNQWNLICTEIEKCNRGSILGIKSFDINNIVVLTKIGLFIYYFNENNKSISLNYFYFMDYKLIEKYYGELVIYENLFSLHHDSLQFDRWVLRLLHNKESFLKYGVELLTFAIKEHELDLIDKIYEKCIEYFKEGGNNRMFLSIISSTMPIFNEYPEYIKRYSLDTNMIIDSFFRNKDNKQECLVLIERRNKNLHLHAFSQSSLIEDLTPSIPWTKYNYKFKDPSPAFSMLTVIQFIIVFFTLPLFFITFSILESRHLINDIYRCDAFATIYYYIFDRFTSKSEQVITPTITFMVPYVKFVNYPRNYNWFKDLIKPKPNPFVTTIYCKEIYKTWSGEALINFKWNTYGKYYYYAIWIGFITLLVCFTIATNPQQFITEDIKKLLLFVSTILGSFYLSVEIREIIYDPIRWFCDPWNYFDVIVYVLPIFTSIYLLKTNDKNDQTVQLISYSCLLLDLRLLLLFKIFKRFCVYFAIIINVAKKVYIFLLLFIIIMVMSFAHAFYILLSPKLNSTKDDPNNPWNLVPTYHEISDKGIVNPNPSLIQPPNENTNMFANYGSAVFAVSLFFTGDTSAFSNWTFQNNWTLVILMTLFTFLTVIYILNVFIGLYNDAMQFDANTSMLVMKAEILAEIELFYLLPHQRRKKNWFPEVIYYYASLDKTREKVNELIKEDKWNAKEFSEMKKSLLAALNIKDSFNNNDNNEILLQKLLEEVNKLENSLAKITREGS